MILCFTNGASLQTIERYVKIYGQCVCKDTGSKRDIQFVVVERPLTFEECIESKAQLWEAEKWWMNTIRQTAPFEYMIKHFNISIKE
jgi:hypothetical protein